MSSITIFFIALCIGATLCHICFIDPPQRGAQLTGMPGDPACYRRTPYCGGIPVEEPVTTYNVNEPILIHMQQNLNHWFPAKPGYLDFSIAYTNTPTDDDFIVLKTFSDFAAHDMVTQTNFTFVLSNLPRGKTCDHCILRARYVSNNPLEIDPKNNTDARFYNCVDLKIVAGSEEARKPEIKPDMEVPNVVAKKSASNVKSCTVPPQWTGTMIEKREGSIIEHTVYYDAVNQRIRWDRIGNISPFYQNLRTYSFNHPKLVEYLHYPAKGKCLAYGPDTWYDWSYGAPAGQAFLRNQTLGGKEVYVWGTNNFEWITTADCEPVGQMQLGFNVVEFLWSSFERSVDDSVFDLPTECGKKEPQSKCGATQEQIAELLRA